MSEDIPVSVLQYLRSIMHKGNPFGYLQLDMQNRVVSMGGDLSLFGPIKIDTAVDVDEQLPSLSGLLPVLTKPVVIANIHTDDSQFTDFHIYFDDGNQWVVFIDTTDTATTMQNNQQSRLTQDIIKEKNTDH